MSKIAKKIADWVDSPTEIAEAIGISPAAISKAKNGQMKMKIGRICQIVHFLKPPQTEVDEMFDLYLEDLDIPPGALRLVITDPQAQPEESASISFSYSSSLSKITDAVMLSDIDDSAKVKVYNIIQSVKKDTCGNGTD
jgi:transcriptional regulator with XRE-family HTH domain